MNIHVSVAELAEIRANKSAPENGWKYQNLTPQAKLLAYYMRTNGDVSAVDAMLNLRGMTSATLARRIVDLEEAGFKVKRDKKINRATGRMYTRYSILN